MAYSKRDAVSRGRLSYLNRLLRTGHTETAARYAKRYGLTPTIGEHEALRPIISVSPAHGQSPQPPATACLGGAGVSVVLGAAECDKSIPAGEKVQCDAIDGALATVRVLDRITGDGVTEAVPGDEKATECQKDEGRPKETELDREIRERKEKAEANPWPEEVVGVVVGKCVNKWQVLVKVDGERVAPCWTGGMNLWRGERVKVRIEERFGVEDVIYGIVERVAEVGVVKGGPETSVAGAVGAKVNGEYVVGAAAPVEPKAAAETGEDVDVPVHVD